MRTHRHRSLQQISIVRLLATVLLVYVLAMQGMLGAFASVRSLAPSANLNPGVICSTLDAATADGQAPDHGQDRGSGHCLLCPVGCHHASVALATPLLAYVLAFFDEPVTRGPDFATEAVGNFPPGWSGSRSSRAPPSLV